MQRVRLLKKVILILGGFFVLVWLSININDIFGSIIKEYVCIILKIIAGIFTLIEVIDIIYRILDKQMSKKAKHLFDDVILNTKQKVNRYIKNCGIKKEYEAASIIMSACISDEILSTEKLNDLVDTFKNSDSQKAAISYFFLKNRSNELIANYLKNNGGFQLECENLSELAVEHALKKSYEFDADDITFDSLQELSLALLHLSLTQNKMDEDNIIYAVRSIINWMCNSNLNNVSEYKKVTSMLVAIFEFKKRFECSKIKNKVLEKDFNKLKKSKLIKTLIKYAYDYLTSGGGKINFDKCVIAANVISFCDQYIGLIQKYMLYSCINEMNLNLADNFSFASDSDFAAVLLLSSSFANIANEKQETDCVSIIAMAFDYSSKFIDKVGGIK